MPAKKKWTREQAAERVEVELIKMAGAVRNRIKCDGMTNFDEILKHDAVWFWLASARRILENTV